MIEIVDYKTEYREYFKVLNLEWIQKYFKVEPADEYVLSNPQSAILDNGGFIFFAKYDAEIVGTCALQKIDDKTFELAKMAVNINNQNKGIGRMLMDKSIQKATEMNLNKLVLYSSTHLTIALNIYSKYGFQLVPKDEHPTSRANIKMELKLKSFFNQGDRYQPKM
jgi:N-acetylglutamate synthase-like GNAT family acetyltransferase